MTSGFRHIGQATTRRDGPDVVTGRTRFLDDIKLSGMLCGRVLRSPHAHALITHVDTRSARELAGVHAVLTWKDVPDWRGGNPRITRVLDRKVRFVGDAVALVAAETAETAAAALDLIEVEYEVLPAVFDAEEALLPDAPQLYEELPGNVLPPQVAVFGPTCLTELIKGDVDGGFAEAEAVAEGTFSCQNLPNPLPPEPPGAIALWEEPNKVTIWVSNQSPYVDKVRLFYMFNREVEIRTLGGPCGGSYGSKLMSWQVQAYAVLLSRATHRPVKVMFSKEEHLSAFVLRPGMRLTGRVGIKKDGSITAVSGRLLVDTGHYSMTTQAQAAVGLGEMQLSLRCPNWDLRPTIVCTNRNASGSVRGFGGQELKCVLMPLVNQALAKLDLDPFQFLKQNFIKPNEDFVWRDGHTYTYRGVDYTAAMDAGAARFGWEQKWKGWLTPTEVRGAKRRGVGVGVHGNADVGEDASEAQVRLHPDGSAFVISCQSEHGTGQSGNVLKMAAEVLQISLDKVTLSPADSLFTPYEFGPAGSRGTYAIGSAVIAAAEDARRQLLELLAPRFHVAADELDTEDGVVFVKEDPERRLPWRAIGLDRTVTGYGRFEPDHTLSNCLMSFVELEVDTNTGRVELLRVVNATDVGRIIDPLSLEGQLNGCLGSAGIDGALWEETVLDSGTGRILNSNLLDYKWRTTRDLPIIENVVLETPVASHRFGALGVGEISTSPGPAAVLMAASNALGVWLRDYPLTPERVLGALYRPGSTLGGET